MGYRDSKNSIRSEVDFFNKVKTSQKFIFNEKDELDAESKGLLESLNYNYNKQKHQNFVTNILKEKIMNIKLHLLDDKKASRLILKRKKKFSRLLPPYLYIHHEFLSKGFLRCNAQETKILFDKNKTYQEHSS